jgi:hypothetical protein
MHSKEKGGWREILEGRRVLGPKHSCKDQPQARMEKLTCSSHELCLWHDHDASK